MKLWILAVGKPGALLRDAIAEYERRAARYWPLEVVEVKAASARNRDPADVRSEESDRVIGRLPERVELVALTRTGDAFSSERLARQLGRAAAQGSAGIAFVIGGAFGLSDQLLRDAHRRIRLSALTLPHDFARLIFAEQLYRAGTIARGEPYHKAKGSG